MDEMMDHIAEYRKLLNTEFQPPSNLSGDGVVYGMFENNARADIGVLIGLKLVREQGWQGRIQLWHVGHHPIIDPSLDVEIYDAREYQAKYGGMIEIWTLKSFSQYHSGLARSQWLDWDAYNVINPQPLFDALNDYRVVYWTGGEAESQANTRWPYNPTIHKGVYGDRPMIGPIQGGTYLVDHVKAWKLLELQRYVDNNYKTWPNRNNYWSDEEGWRLSIAATRVPVITDRLEWRALSWINWFKGNQHVVHRCNGKLWSDCIPDFNEAHPHEQRVRELYFKFQKEHKYNLTNRVCNPPKDEIVCINGKDRVQALRDRAKEHHRRKFPPSPVPKEVRISICKGCPEFRKGEVKAEIWCHLVDDQPNQKNCEGSRHRRWKARIQASELTCPLDKWVEVQ